MAILKSLEAELVDAINRTNELDYTLDDLTFSDWVTGARDNSVSVTGIKPYHGVSKVYYGKLNIFSYFSPIPLVVDITKLKTTFTGEDVLTEFNKTYGEVLFEQDVGTEWFNSTMARIDYVKKELSVDIKDESLRWYGTFVLRISDGVLDINEYWVKKPVIEPSEPNPEMVRTYSRDYSDHSLLLSQVTEYYYLQDTLDFIGWGMELAQETREGYVYYYNGPVADAPADVADKIADYAENVLIMYRAASTSVPYAYIHYGSVK